MVSMLTCQVPREWGFGEFGYKLKNKDAIHIEEAIEGRSRQMKIADVAKWEKLIELNGVMVNTFSKVMVNDKVADLADLIQPEDDIRLLYHENLGYWVEAVEVLKR